MAKNMSCGDSYFFWRGWARDILEDEVHQFFPRGGFGSGQVTQQTTDCDDGYHQGAGEHSAAQQEVGNVKSCGFGRVVRQFGLFGLFGLQLCPGGFDFGHADC